jgi:2-polyprenyl-3-methyl-5-hydroxy-6-metoxy-1,4-benzoquinol methylase
MEGIAHSERWQQEAEFFDALATTRAQQAEPIDPRKVARYQSSGRLFPKEYCCHLLGDVRGKSVLDFGCGEGDDALLLASLGARVTAIDISPKAIEFARTRAKLSGVADLIEFVCAPIEVADLPAASFDVIWGDNILHHVLPVLDETLAALMRAAKPGAQVLFTEPVNLSPTLRRLRLLVPLETDSTPGERPLEFPDFEVIRRHVPDLEERHFRFLARLMRIILPTPNLETASPFRRALTKILAAIDYALLTMPFVQRLGGSAVFYGRAPAAAQQLRS